MQIFLERTHWEQEGLFSSHLMRRCLQLLQPVLTLGLLVRALLGFCCESEVGLDEDTEFAELASAWFGDDIVGNLGGVRIVAEGITHTHTHAWPWARGRTICISSDCSKERLAVVELKQIGVWTECREITSSSDEVGGRERVAKDRRDDGWYD